MVEGGLANVCQIISGEISTGMQEIINNFPKQFEFAFEIKNAAQLKVVEKYIVMGMGGSHLPADVLKIRNRYLPLYIHKNYGLPPLSPKEFESSFLIAVSFSGNTEETIDFAKEALGRNYNLGVVTGGGKLLKIAEEARIPYIQIPNEGLEPRTALGYLTAGLAKFLDEDIFKELQQLPKKLKPESWEDKGRALSETLTGKVPVIYASDKNQGLAYVWKIKINETSKVPAFFNVFPELNHNELAGFDLKPETEQLSKNFHFIFIDDPSDKPRIRKRINLTKKIYEEKGMPVTTLELQGETPFEKIFNSLLLSDWVSFYLSKKYNTDPISNELVEKFKKQINTNN